MDEELKAGVENAKFLLNYS